LTDVFLCGIIAKNITKEVKKMGVFGLSHILYFVISSIIGISIIFVVKKFVKCERGKKISTFAFAGVLLAVLVASRVVALLNTINYVREYGEYATSIRPIWLVLIPTSICSVINLIFAVTVLVVFKNRNHKMFHFIVYMSFIGGFVTAFYPDFIGQDPTIFSARTFLGLLHHTIAMFLAIYLVVMREFKPALKEWKAILIGTLGFIVLGLFLQDALGFSNAVNLNDPLLPGLHWWIVYPTFVVGFIGVLFVYELIREKNFRLKVVERIRFFFSFFVSPIKFVERVKENRKNKESGADNFSENEVALNVSEAVDPVEAELNI